MILDLKIISIKRSEDLTKTVIKLQVILETIFWIIVEMLPWNI